MSAEQGKPVDKPLYVLIVEDSEDDADLLVRELRRAGYELVYQRVDTAEGLHAALAGQVWDLVLADYSMPSFSGTQALAVVRSRGLDVPFIFVSGTIGEDTAVAAMKAGAQDYLTKGNLKRLAPAIERELRETEVRRERSRAEEKLKKLSRAVEQSANLVIITDADGVIEYVNPKFLDATGYALDEVSGRKPSLWKSGKTSDKEYAELWRTILAGDDWHGEFENKRRDGSVMSVSAVISPIKDESGRITHFIGIQEDITHRKELERQLQRSQRMEALGQLTGGLAHDFNNLLMVIIGNLELMEGEIGESTPQSRQRVRNALDASFRGAQLIRQLLAFARRQPLAEKTFNLNELTSKTMELLRRTLGEQITIDLALADGLWPTVADPTQVETALANLAINARDAMPGGGRLTIETANKHLDEQYAAENVDVTPGDYVMLAVSDTGTGIPPDVLSRVFEPFFTTKGQGRGTGLGLSMIYGFVKQSRGHIKIYSEVGHGTTVRLYLPRAETGPVAPAAEAPPEEPQGIAGGATILLVEDNASVRATAAMQLASLGYRVIEAADAAAALAILDQGQAIDLLFTDMVMPGGMTGVQLAREARERRPELKVLFTSGFIDAAVQNDLRAEGFAGFLSKPYRKRDLARRVHEILRGNRGKP
jgi:PAS domain S-box-containing protein